MKNGQIGRKFGDKKISFSPKVCIFEFFLPFGHISPVKETLRHSILMLDNDHPILTPRRQLFYKGQLEVWTSSHDVNFHYDFLKVQECTSFAEI
jgi:hypothetical protein